jgi:hypothetical protein
MTTLIVVAIASVVIAAAVVVFTVVVERFGWLCNWLIAPSRLWSIVRRRGLLPAIGCLGSVRWTLTLRTSSSPSTTSAFFARFPGLIIKISGRGFVRRFLLDVHVFGPRAMFVMRGSVVSLAALASRTTAAPAALAAGSGLSGTSRVGVAR